jgi:hypothetical protein
MPRADITGQRFGRLTAIRYLYTTKWGCAVWLCKCDCGNTCEVEVGTLRAGRTKSCGCLIRERAQEQGRALGKSNANKPWSDLRRAASSNEETPDFQLKKHLKSAWRRMRNRCTTNQESHTYSYYAGRGIQVDPVWDNDFEAFYKWSIEHGYQEGKKLSLDRIDNNGPYAPWNCRWTDAYTQVNNRSTTRRINGESFSDVCLRNNIDSDIVQRRLNRGWDLDRALTTPSTGKANSVATLCARLSLPYKSINQYLRDHPGADFFEAVNWYHTTHPFDTENNCSVEQTDYYDL